MTGSSLSNWDGSLTAQKRPDADHSSVKEPHSVNALHYASMSRVSAPYMSVDGAFDVVNGVLQAVSVSGINEMQSEKNSHGASYSSRNLMIASSSSPSSSYAPDYLPTARIDMSMSCPQVTIQTTDTIVPAEDRGLLGVDNSRSKQDELMNLVKQTMPLSHAMADTADAAELNSTSFPSGESNVLLRTPKVRSAQLPSSPKSTSPSPPEHISPLFTPPPPPKRRRIFMSHVAVPPLPRRRSEYKIVTPSRHGLPRKAKDKAVDLIQVFGNLRTAFQEEEAMRAAEPFSSSLRPSMIGHRRSQSYSSDDEILLTPNRKAEFSSSPKKRRKPSIEVMPSPLPRKRPKKDEVHAGADQHTQSAAGMREDGRGSVIREPLPKIPKVKLNPSKRRKESVGPRTYSLADEARTKSVSSRTKSIETSLSSDDEPVMTFSVYYDDTLEHVRLIDARQGIYEYTMQDEDPVTEEVLSMNLQFIKRRLKGHRVTEDLQWYDPDAGSTLGVDVEPTGTPSSPPTMSAKARGKQKAVPISPAKDILLSPQYHIEADLGNDFVHLEGNHLIFDDPHTGISGPRVGPATHPPLVHHFPMHNSTTVFCSSSSHGKEQLLGPLHDFSSIGDNAYLHDSALDLPNIWLENSEPLHDGTIDPSLLGGFEFMDHSPFSSSSSSSGSPRQKSPSPLPNLPPSAVQIEPETHPSVRLPSPQRPIVPEDQPTNDKLDEWEMSDLTSLDDSSPCINPIPLDPPPPAPSRALSKQKTHKVKVGPPARKRSEWPMTDKASFCHQCRGRSFRLSVYCGCGKVYCVKCITTKYDNLEFDADAKDFVCPRCTNTCTCDVCTRARGEVYHSARTGSTKRALVSSSRPPRKSSKSQKIRDVETGEDHDPVSLHRLNPAQLQHRSHVQRHDFPHVSPLGGRTNIPPLSERKQGPVKYWGTIYGFSGEKIGTAYIPEDGSSNTLLVQRSRVFVGEIQPVWGLGTNPSLRVVDPAKKMVDHNDAQKTRRRFVGQQAPLFMPIRTIDSSGVMEYESDADGDHDPEEPRDRLTPNDEHPGFEWRRGEELDPDKISLADEDVTSVCILSLKQIGITAMASTG